MNDEHTEKPDEPENAPEQKLDKEFEDQEIAAKSNAAEPTHAGNRIIRLDLSTIDRLTPKRQERLYECLKMACETSSSLVFEASSLDQEPADIDDDRRNHEIEVRVLEAVNKHLSTANTSPLSADEVSALESISEQHHAQRLSRLLSEEQRRESVSKWGTELAREGIKVVIRLLGIPL